MQTTAHVVKIVHVWTRRHPYHPSRVARHARHARHATFARRYAYVMSPRRRPDQVVS